MRPLFALLLPPIILAGPAARGLRPRRRGDRRRGALPLLALLALLPGALWAQPGEKVHRIGLLSPVSASLDQFHRASVPELAKAGFELGRNLVVEFRAGPAGELPRLAAELVRLRPELIFAISLPAVLAVRSATDALPVVIIASTDPVAAGWAANLARPGGNLTGVAILGPELDAKRLQVLRELVPGARRIAILADPAISSERHLDVVRTAARELGLTLELLVAARPDDIAPALGKAKTQGAEAINVLASPMFNAEARAVAAAAASVGLVTMCQWREMAEAGCLASYGPTLTESWRIAGGQIGRLLHGARAADIPIEQPTRFELVLNGRMARSLDFPLTPEIIARADEVIE
jgi:putative ABC transport system substrate-binding protein